MKIPWKLAALIFAAVAVGSSLAGKPKPVKGPAHADAPPPVIISNTSGDSLMASSLAPENQYFIGSPSDEEQALVELINRARVDANAEALRLANATDEDVLEAICFFGVDLPEMINQFATLPQNLPPLSINPELTTMARLHSEDMLDNVFQGHISSASPPAPFSPADTLADRVAEFPYPFAQIGENVYAFSQSYYYGHASFEIDWGFDAFGMQVPPGHRETIHGSAYREIGIGVIEGSNTSGDVTVGPMIITQVFGSVLSSVPFITGVAYYDLNSNGLYDAGEGLGGLTVSTAEGSGWAVTADSGGYSIPVTSNGDYNVTITGLGITPQTTPVSIVDGQNSKEDLILEYTPPELAGSSSPFTGLDNEYIVSSTPGATSYSVKVFTESTAAWLEGAEDGTVNVTIENSLEYTSVQSDVVRNGLNAFHLAHTTDGVDQIITLNHTILPSGSSELRFGSRLQYATEFQTANVDVSIDRGATWINIYRQEGNWASGEAGFIYRSLPLGAYQGQPLSVRFRYSVEGCNPKFFIDTTTDVGWIIDDITVVNSSRLTTESETSINIPEFLFNPPVDGQYLLTVQPLNNLREFPFGPLLRVTAAPATELELWRLDHFSQADLNDPSKESTIWGDLADPEKDGLGNLLEYALNGDPNQPDAASLLPQLSRSGDQLTLTYTMYRSNLVYRVRTNTLLDDPGWTGDGVIQTPDPDTALPGTEISAATTLEGNRRFLSLEVTVP